MFGWRKRQIADKTAADINGMFEYIIGINQAGNTQLCIKLDYGSATLTMAPGAVLKMIRQLEATLDYKDEVE